MSMQASAVKEKMRGLRHLVGNSPILSIELKWRGEPRTIYAKAEQGVIVVLTDRPLLYR